MTKDGTAEFIAVDARAAAIFDLVYPIGSIFATTGSAPARGTWEEIAQGRTLQGADSNHAAGTTIEAGLPNFKGTFNTDYARVTGHITTKNVTVSTGIAAATSSNSDETVTIDLSKASRIYGKSSTVQPPAYVVHFYRRTA